MAAKDGVGERRRTRSPDERKRIVEEALAPGVSVAAVARRHGLNANLIFKWIRRSREGWRDRRREPAKEKPVVVAPPEGGAKATPILSELRAFLDATMEKISGKSRSRGAFRYVASRWTALTRYVDDGRLEMTNTNGSAVSFGGDYRQYPA